jgi:putative serine/threonine protein kinase
MPYVKVLCYPSGSPPEAARRKESLSSMGVETLFFEGRTEVAGLRVLGKGHVGVVVGCLWKGRRAALKIRRTDTARASLEREGEVLREANLWNIGPLLHDSSPNFLVMEELHGRSLIEWLEGAKTLTGDEFMEVLANICAQARLLDIAGIDHRELSDPRRHVVIQDDRRARLLDFETASTGGRRRNVNSLLQYLTLSNAFGPVILSRLGANREDVLGALKAYGRDPSAESYSRIMRAMNLR